MRMVCLMNILFEFVPVISSQSGTGSNPYKTLFIRQDASYGRRQSVFQGDLLVIIMPGLKGKDTCKLYNECYA